MRNLIAIELIKERYSDMRKNTSFNILEDLIYSYIVIEMWKNIMILSDDEVQLILISSEYSRIHKGFY